MIGSGSETAAAGLIALFLLFVLRALRIGKRGDQLPPGPATLPLREFCASSSSLNAYVASVGNLHIFPSEHPYYKSVVLLSYMCVNIVSTHWQLQVYRMGEAIWRCLLCNECLHLSKIILLHSFSYS
jgi:hypothetical protein